MLSTMKKFAVDNSPAILTSLAVAGTVTTAVLTGRAVLAADRLLQEKLYKLNDQGYIVETGVDLTTRETLEIVWKEFVPPVLVGGATIVACLGANHVGARRAAALAAGFKVVEEMASEYKQKVVTTIGKKAEEDIRTKIVEDRLKRDEPTLIITNDADVTFFDPWSGRYFQSNMETIRKAMNDVNFQINNSYYASVTDFYNLIGLDSNGQSDNFGWNSDNLMEIVYTTALMANNRPCIQIEYRLDPINGYDRLR